MAQANVKKAMRKHKAAAAGRAAKLQGQRAGTEGSKLNDRVSSAFRGPKRRNS